MQPVPPFNFQAWIDEHRDDLKPPVCNRQVFDEGEFIVMVVGGPNTRTDYHYDVAPEFFYQLEGEMLLKTMQNGKRIDYPIRAGEIFMLPAEMPHCPQRFANSVGLVIERKRKRHEEDGFLWYCDNCDALLYEEYLFIGDIVEDLPPVFERFYGTPEAHTCSQCGHVLETPASSPS